MKTRLLISLFACLALHSISRAQDISFATDFGTATSQVSIGAPIALDFSQFDTTLGTLTSVMLTLDISGSTATSQVINLSSSGPQSYTNAFTQMTADLAGPDGTTVSIQEPQTELFSGTTTAGQFSISNAGTDAFGPATGAAGVAAPNLGSYEGAGSGNLIFELSGTFFSHGTAGPVGFGGLGTAYGTINVDYGFTAIPEPSTCAFALGVGAFCCVVLRRGKGAVRT